MTKRQRLLNALIPVFKGLGSTSIDLSQKNAKGKKAKNDAVYEAYLYALVCQTLDALGYNPQALPNPGIFRFRRGPGRITSTPGTFSYVEFTKGTNEYELHCDTKVLSRSAGAVLEIDIVIIAKGHARQCRKNGSDPTYRRVHFVLEAKYHRTGIGTVIAKSYVGICERIRLRQCANALVSSGTLSPNAASLLAGVNPPLLPFPHVSAAAAHTATVLAFSNSLIAQIPTVI